MLQRLVFACFLACRFMKMIPHQELYTTSEWPLICSLVTFGHQIEHIDRTDPLRVVFGFRRQGNIEQIIENFWKGGLNVPVVSFYQNLRLLKARLKNEQNF